MASTELVEKVKESRWMKDGEMVSTFYITLVDGTGQREVPSYSPLAKDLKEDAPLPDGWEVRTSQKGKLYLAAPKPPGGGKSGPPSRPTAWANTEEGEKYVQERMDRRTALMQAVAVLYGGQTPWQSRAEEMYDWLRKNLDVSAPAVDGRTRPSTQSSSPRQTSPDVGADTSSDGGGDQPGEAPPSPSTDVCVICGKGWGPTTTSSGKRICVAGHVERFG